MTHRSGAAATDPTGRRAWLALAAVVLLALVLRFDGLDRESLFMDEIRQVSNYARDLPGLVDGARSQQQPPLDYLLGKLAWTVAESDFAVRVPAALFGSLLVGLLWLYARRLTSAWSATLIALACAMSPFALYYSQEARPYAITMCLGTALLWGIDRFMRSARAAGAGMLLVGCGALVFLASRTLLPLVLVLTLGLLLAVDALLEGRGRGASRRTRHAWLGVAALAAAVLAYLPLFLSIVQAGQHYAPHATEFTIGRLADALLALPYRELAAAYVAQAEPLAWPLALLAGLGLALSTGDWVRGRRDGIRHLLGALFVGHLLLYGVLFRAATGFPLRPPYLAMLLPIALLLAAIGTQWLWEFATPRLPRRTRQPVLLTALAALAIFMAPALLDSRQLVRKPDWRGVAELLRGNYGEDHVLLFDSLAVAGTWKPYFYGFERYDAGRALQVPLRDWPFVAERAAALEKSPVLLLFHFGEYRLTRRSRVPVMQHAGRLAVPPLAASLRERGFDVTELHGFTVVAPREPSGALFADSRHLLASVAAVAGDDRGTYDIHLALAAIALWCEPAQYREHRDRAARYAAGHREQELAMLSSLAEAIPRQRPQACGPELAVVASAGHGRAQ